MPFDEETVTDTLASVIKQDVDLDALPKDIPWKIRELVESCLEKDVQYRLRDIGEAWRSLKRLTTDSGRLKAIPDAPTAPTSSRGVLIAGAMVAGALIIAAALVFALSPDAPTRPIKRFSINLTADAALGSTDAYRYIPAVSPDGTMLVYPGQGESAPLYLRYMDRIEPQPILGTESGVSPFFSPDSQWIGYFSIADNELKKVSVLGGPPVPLCKNPASLPFVFGDWGKNGSIIFSGAGASEPLSPGDSPSIFPFAWSGDGTKIVGTRTGDAGDFDIVLFDTAGGGAGANQAIAPLIATSFDERNPAISPNGKWIAYQSDESGTIEIFVRPFPDVDGGRHQITNGGGREPLWSPDGTELYYRGGDSMMAVPVETEGKFARRSAVAIFPDTYRRQPNGTRTYDIHPDGERFLMIKSGSEAGGGVTELIVVENWIEKVKQLASPPQGN